MKTTTKLIAASALLACAGAAFSQNSSTAEPRNVVQLAATGTVEVQQDLLVLNLSTNKEAADAATVQTQLKQALDTALTEAKRNAQPGQLDVRTGPFGLYPRYGKDGKINGWQGRAEPGAGGPRLCTHHRHGGQDPDIGDQQRGVWSVA